MCEGGLVVCTIEDPSGRRAFVRCGLRFVRSADRSAEGTLHIMGTTMTSVLGKSGTRAAVAFTRRDCAEQGEIVAVDPPLQAALRTIERAATRRGGVLIMGPTGVGKELLARRVHERSGRSGAFVALNCAAFAETLVESALFGHERGAFTGAVRRVPGALVEAHQGTLFLDEFGELSATVQAKLLRALEDGSVRAVGASGASHVDVRVVAATNRDLRRAVERGEFREDLYFRVATFVLEVPPLRERPGDLAALVRKLVTEHDRGRAVRLSAAAEATLLAYAWPGNVRELRNVIERVFCLACGGELGCEELVEIAPELAIGAGAIGPGTATLAGVKEHAIADRLRGGGTQQQVAEDLGVHRTTLWRRAKRLSEGR
ncbi:sigma 54-interacting transcriptional regulator [Sorangium sp. So ce117]|uniref:sigma 54-interacting transcriptional regulator n=1 Tax=Sorangium sp. So ce117 TaxID=3133277 RepID=UPI003F627DAC